MATSRRGKAQKQPSLGGSEPPEFLKLLEEFQKRHGPVKRKLTKPVVAKAAQPTAAAEFGARLSALYPGLVVDEHKFALPRKWRFDWCFPHAMLAIEIDGQGRHQTYVGFRGDCEKLNAAVELGWRVLRFVAAERKHMDEWVAQTRRCLFSSSGQDDSNGIPSHPGHLPPARDAEGHS